MNPKVSVVVPVYNVEKYLQRCVDSIRHQTLKDIEIILIDDGSPDNCPKMCDEYARIDPRIKVIHKQNAGLGMACNSGLDVARGEYVAFCDSDDWVDEEMYEKMYQKASINHSDAVYSGLRRVNSSGIILGLLPHPKEDKIYEGYSISDLANDIIASQPSCRYDRTIQVSAKVVLYRRSVIDDNNIRFVSERQFPSEDLIFNLLFLKYATRAIVIPEYFYNYFVNDNSITSTFNSNRFNRMMKTVEHIKNLIPQLNSESEVRLSRYIIGEARVFSTQIFNSSISKSEKLNLLNSLSQNPYFCNAVKNYPVAKMPWKHFIVMFMLKKHFFSLLGLICKYHH